jgi:hypothetical protein
MTKTEKWPARVLYMLVAVALALGLLLSPAVGNVAASPDETEWETVGTPTGENWKLAPGSDDICDIMPFKGVYYWAGGQIFGIALTAGGNNLYVVGMFRDIDDLNKNDNICEIVPQLLKSTDGGATWTAKTDKVFKELVDEGIIPDVDDSDDPVRHTIFERVTCDPLNADFVVVQVAFDNSALGPGDPPERWAPKVLVSDDGASAFSETGEIQQGEWFMSIIHALATTVENDDEHDMAVSGILEEIGNPSNRRGGVFRLVTGGIAPGWQDTTRYDGWDDAPDGWPDMGPLFQSAAAVNVRYGVDFATHGTVLVTSVTMYDPTGTPVGDIYLQAGTWGKTEAWNEEAGFEPAVMLKDDVVIYAIQSAVAGITLPLDSQWRYASKRYAWVNVNYGTDDSDPWDPDNQVGEILKVLDDDVDPIIQQVRMGGRQPWLSNVAYWGYIESGKAVAGVFGEGYALPYNVYPGHPEYGLARAAPVFTPCCEGVQVYRNTSIEDMDICCKGWKDSCKPPTGRGGAAAFFVSDQKALAIVARSPYDSAYDESALSVSFDDGETWNQLSLIDTHIDYMTDVAVSPNCNKHMIVTINIDDEDCNPCCVGNDTPIWWNDYDCGIMGPGYIGIDYADPEDYPSFYCDYETGCDSVWLMANELAEADEYSGTWLRTWCGVLENDYGLLRLAPEEENGETVYLVDWRTDTVYWNNMETLACWEMGNSLVDDIFDLAVKDEATIYALDHNGDVSMSDDHGATASWEDPVPSELEIGHTIAVKGDMVIVGGEKADVSVSDDGGENFDELDRIDCGGDVHVAFDCYSEENDTIYAATANGGCNGVYRWVLDDSSKWKDLGAEPFDYYGIVVDNPDGNPMTDASTGCVLYAAYVNWDGDPNDDNWYGQTGVARVLNPAEEVCCGEQDWSYLHMSESCDEFFEEDAEFSLEPSSLKICGCLTADSNTRLWAIDWSAGYYDRECCESYFYDCCDCYGDPYWLDCDCGCVGRLWTYEDCFSKGAPDLVSPADGTMVAADECYCWNEDVTLKWERMCNACSYDVQVALDEDFNDVIWEWRNYDPWEDRRASASEPSVVITEGELDCASTFYWRVRVSDAETGEYIYSWWSEARSFTVEVGPLAAIALTAPDNGVTNVPITGISFTWTAVTDASGYDWVLSANADLSSPVESKTGLTGTAYTFTGTLQKNTAYYWRVTAKKDGVVISTSDISTFTTAPEKPAPPPQPAPPKTPTWVWVIIAIGAVLVIVVIVLIFRTRRV